MSPGQQRVIVERRLVRDRRRGLDRRMVDRRLHVLAVEVERRGGAERRSSQDRRGPLARRSGVDRRRQGSSEQTTDVIVESP